MKKQSLDFDELGDKHKKFEGVSQIKLIPMLPTLARLDGRAFHTLTRNAEKPFDLKIVTSMQETAKQLLDAFNADFAYVQSDEITLGWNVLDMFDGKIQKMTSLMASHAGVIFDRALQRVKYNYTVVPIFDCRIWQLPTMELAAENVMWREMDATRNSISMTACAHFTTAELHKKGTNTKLKMLEDKGVMWSAFHSTLKRGTYYKKVQVLKELTQEELALIPEKHRPTGPVQRNVIQQMDYPKATSITNFGDVLFNNVSVIIKE